jgi:glycosyltransferase involved in cell wall biosynthesis
LVIDDHWPQPDRDSGSIDIVNLVHALDALGFDVILAAARQHDNPSPERDALMRRRLRCLLPSDAASVDEFLVQQGHSLDLCVLCRVYCGGRFLEAVRRHARAARVIFNTIDLAFLREERRAEVTDDTALRAAVRDIRAREEEIIRGSEATLVVSRAEFDLLAEEVSEALVAEMPLARALTPPSTSFARRAGIGFIGGFAHAPNIDGMRYFLAEIWPLVLRDLPDLELTVVGADFPAELLAGVPGRVRSLGHMPNVVPWFEGLRLTIAPLRFGAGAKGKVASSLAAGVPCIATSLAAEGMSLSEAAGVLVENDPAAFAVRLRDVYTDEALWNRLSTGGLAYAAETLSLSRWRDRLDALLRQIGL